MPGMVIIGAGQAGGRAALTLREQGWQGSVTLIGGESYAPYERPPLSKAFLHRSVGESEITFADDDTLRDAAVDFRRDTRVVGIDRSARRVVIDRGESIPYERLLLATGRRPRRLDVPGATLDGICYLRDMEDARALSGRLRAGTRLVVVGGGFIGLEVAASASALGAQVTVVELGPRLLMRAVPEELAAVLTERHRQAGVEIRCGAQVAAFHGESQVNEVQLSDGTRLAADAVVVGVGATPRDELAREAGLRVEQGVVVGDMLVTEDPHIYAVGDVCAFPHPLGDGLLRLETWQNANDQGAHAARNMLGAGEPYRTVPWFWSDQYEFVLQMAGYPELGTEVVSRDVGENARLRFYLDGSHHVVGVSGIGPTAIGRDVRIGQKLIERGCRVMPETLADPATKLKQLLKQSAGA